MKSVRTLCLVLAGTVIFVVILVVAAQRGTRKTLPLLLRQALETAPTFTLYSLHPRAQPPAKGGNQKPGFHGYTVLGRTTVTDPQERARLLQALYRGVAESDGRAAACFNPRHGIRVVVGSRTVDLVICFECLQVEIFDNQQESFATLTRSPQPVFDDFLTRAGVPLPNE